MAARSTATTTHGQARIGSVTSEYNAWHGIIERTTNSNGKDWREYGGRGIAVCDRWLKFEHFFADMGPKPTPTHSIDRINNDGPYCKENCRWATHSEQNNNQRRNVRLMFYGMKKTVTEWSRLTLVSAATIRKRLRLGWPSRLSVWAPVGSKLVELKAKYPHHT